EQPVCQHLDAKVLQRVVLYPAEQVMPLQHLMQQDAVEESSQREAEQQRGPEEAAVRGCFHAWLSPWFGCASGPRALAPRLRAGMQSERTSRRTTREADPRRVPPVGKLLRIQ